MTMKLNQATLLKNQAFINGTWVGAQSGKTFAVTNPATGAVIVEVPDMGEAETQAAIDAAAEAAKRRAIRRSPALVSWIGGNKVAMAASGTRGQTTDEYP